jgi:succinoglycan biosynthesis transport protein ExoP
MTMSSIERFSNLFDQNAPAGGTPILEVIWRQKFLIALFGVMGVVCGFWYYLEQPRVYQSTAVVLVKERQTAPITAANIELAPRDGMETQLQVIASRAVLSRAAQILTNPSLAKSSDGASEESDSETESTEMAPLIVNESEKEGVTSIDGGQTNSDSEADKATAPADAPPRLKPARVDPRLPDSLAGGLKASIINYSEAISVSFRTNDPDLAKRSLEAILAAYDMQLRSAYLDVGEETARLIKKASETQKNDITKKREAYEEFRNDPEKKDKFLMVDGQLANIQAKRLLDLTAQQSQLESKLLTIDTELKQIEKITETSPVDSVAAIAVISKLNELTGGVLLQTKDLEARGVERSSVEIARLTDLLLQEKDLSARYGEEHPAIKDSRDKITLLSEIIEKLEKEMKEAALERVAGGGDQNAAAIPLPKSPDEWVATYAGMLKHDQARLKAEKESLDAAITEGRKLAQDLDLLIVKDTNFRESIKQAEALNEEILRRLSEIDIVKESGGTRAVILNPASTARQVAPSINQILALAGLLGCGLGVGIGYLLERGNGTFRSPKDITQHLELQILGQVPSIEPRRVKRAAQFTSIPQTIITAHQPASSISESFRAIRTALYFSGEGKDSQVIQVTSPTPGDGKSTLISNLAVSIAKSGKRVLLIDADLRRPTLHRIFGVVNDVGLVSYLASDDSDRQIEPIATLIPGLSILPSGPAISNPSELLSGARMGDLIKSLRESYDFVLIDTPPVLAVTDPLTVAARVDGVIMAIRIANRVQFSSRRAKEALDRVGATILGVVVNGFAPNSAFARGVAKDYGYSGSYGYGYRSGYGYSRNPYIEPYAECKDSSRSTPVTSTK